MTLYFSKSTNGFYDSNINTNIPADSVEITSQQHADLLNAQTNGHIIISDSNGNPQTTPLPGLNSDELIYKCKNTAISILSSTDWIELSSVGDASKSPYLKNVSDFIAYRNVIRGYAVNPVTNPQWPTPPEKIWG